MSDSIRIWNIAGTTLSEVARQSVDLEARLEDWMHSDVSVLSDDLLVIGRQVDTEGSGILDLLCLNRNGDLYVVELKRGKTHREVIAQVLDYGAWAADLSFEHIQEVGNHFFKDEGGLDVAFHRRFEIGLPDVLNAEHHLLIVASEIDTRSERIIRYLSEAHGMSINAVTFNYFQTDDGRELLARTHLIEPDAVEERTGRRVGSKRRRSITLEDHREKAAQRGVSELFDQLVDGLSRWRKPDPAKTMVTFYFRDEDSWMATFNVVTSESSAEEGLRFNAYKHRISRAFGITPEQLVKLLPQNAEPWVYYTPSTAEAEHDWEGFTGAFTDADSIRMFLDGLAQSPQKPRV